MPYTKTLTSERTFPIHLESTTERGPQQRTITVRQFDEGQWAIVDEYGMHFDANGVCEHAVIGKFFAPNEIAHYRFGYHEAIRIAQEVVIPSIRQEVVN